MKKQRTLVSLMAALVLFAGVPLFGQYAPSGGSNLSAVAARFVASNYNYPVTSNYIVNGGTSSTGTGSITVQTANIALPDGRTIYPYNIFTPIIVGGPSDQELVTPTAVSNCYNLATGNGTCTLTATFTYTHGNGEPVISGTGGLAEATYDAFLLGGGIVAIDRFWARGVNTSCSACYASSDAAINSILVWPSVQIESDGSYPGKYWSAAPSTDTFLGTPVALTSTTWTASTTPAGSWTAAAYIACVAYVDVAGNEGACSPTATITPAAAASSFTFTAPAASAGAVGYTIYIDLVSGSYAFAYQVPITSSVCTLTTIESVTPACAMANTTYGQSASSAVVTALTVATSPLALQLGTISTTADYVGNSNAHTTYAYVGGNHLALTGALGSSQPFTACPATVATTVPCVLGTLAVPAGFMNFVSKEIRVCGKLEMTNASATIEQIQLWWDGAGSDATGVPVEIANLRVGGTGTAVAYNGAFCWEGFTTAQGTSTTAGSIEGGFASYYLGIASAPVASFTSGTDTFTATTGSLNLAGGAGFTSRLHIVQLHTTGTDVSPQLTNVTLEVVN